MKNFINIYPRKIPTIPKIPSILSGAGIGNLIKPNTNPTIIPVISDNIIFLFDFPRSNIDILG